MSGNVAARQGVREVLFVRLQSNALKPFKLRWRHYSFHSDRKELKTLFQNANSPSFSFRYGTVIT